jgi:hypothetical protein
VARHGSRGLGGRGSSGVADRVHHRRHRPRRRPRPDRCASWIDARAGSTRELDRYASWIDARARRPEGHLAHNPGYCAPREHSAGSDPAAAAAGRRRYRFRHSGMALNLPAARPGSVGHEIGAGAGRSPRSEAGRSAQGSPAARWPEKPWPATLPHGATRPTARPIAARSSAFIPTSSAQRPGTLAACPATPLRIAGRT